ncbi:hypothetical protein AWW67_16225 [Roseivirga seohaensis]|uniref:HTH cro/C1-type domain-containing protein n=1 Tax=Roseivirga seohaensis TaxID=1914963 RepID=A0A150Y2N8_9BACT|nr:helix-turn-helix transcriptional regulator [Roseivirga seohaensis]KYG85257.1 hypothetical protein AWW67_16225 [Roseivirga seohaensis]
MSKIEEKLNKLAAENPVSDWKKQIEYRKANKGWLKKSGRVALRVLDALDDKGWSQAELARQLEVSPQQVTKIVKGQSDFKFSTIDKLEKVLGIQLQAILFSDEIVIKKERKEYLENEVFSKRQALESFGKSLAHSTHRSEKRYLKVA